MAHAVRNFLQNEERAPRVLIETSMVILTLGLMVAVGAIFFMN